MLVWAERGIFNCWPLTWNFILADLEKSRYMLLLLLRSTVKSSVSTVMAVPLVVMREPTPHLSDKVAHFGSWAVPVFSALLSGHHFDSGWFSFHLCSRNLLFVCFLLQLQPSLSVKEAQPWVCILCIETQVKTLQNTFWNNLFNSDVQQAWEKPPQWRATYRHRKRHRGRQDKQPEVGWFPWHLRERPSYCRPRVTPCDEVVQINPPFHPAWLLACVEAALMERIHAHKLLFDFNTFGLRN